MDENAGLGAAETSENEDEDLFRGKERFQPQATDAHAASAGARKRTRRRRPVPVMARATPRATRTVRKTNARKRRVSSGSRSSRTPSRPWR